MGTLKLTPSNEMQTREWFAAHISESDYDIIVSQGAFPDYTLQDADGQIHRVEVEYKSGNFIQHKHDPQGCDFILCWIHNAELTVPVLELSTGKRYKANELNRAEFDKEEFPKSAPQRMATKKEKIIKITEGKAAVEYAAFVKCFDDDLKKTSEFLDYVTPTRLKLLSATNILTIALREHGVKIDALHPSDLFRLTVK